METKTKLGLIGKGISYSFSQKFFEDKFKKLMLHDFSYQLLDLESEVALQNFLQDCPFLGLNVTIPYKEKIIPFLDELSVEAQEIGAVNTVLFNNNKKIGYNTDVIGFEKTLQLFQKSHHQSAIVLGNGGAAKAVAFVLKKNKIPFTIVSRTEGISFENLSPRVVSENTIIVQCTPVGTFPNVDNCLYFPFDGLSEAHLVIDLIYNPTLSLFLQNAQKRGAKTVNGLYMLEQQAEAAWEIWRKK
jgi:shikimate dehydrogenase